MSRVFSFLRWMMPEDSFSTLLSDSIRIVRLGQFSNCSNYLMRLKLTVIVSRRSDLGRSVRAVSRFSLISSDTRELH